MTDPDLPLKLDRILANQERILAGQRENNEAIAALTAGLETLGEAMDVQRELLARLAEAASDEEGGQEMRELIARLEGHLAQLVGDSGRMVTQLARMPNVVERAVMDAARMMRGDGADAPPQG